MLRISHLLPISASLCALLLPSMAWAADNRATPQPVSKLPLHAALVLTPEFCATKSKKGAWGINRESFDIGKAACAELEPALKNVFSDLKRVEDASNQGDADVVLVPKFVDIGATQKMGAFSNRELVVLVEWTVRDKSGKTVWVETVQGSAKHHQGNMFTHGKNVRLIVRDSVKDVAEQSAIKMSAAPQLRSLNSGVSS